MFIRRILTLLVLSSLALPTIASAATPKEPASQFYIFDTQAFEGSVKGPGMGVMDGHRKVEFARLLELKKDLVPGIFQSRRDPVFK